MEVLVIEKENKSSPVVQFNVKKLFVSFKQHNKKTASLKI